MKIISILITIFLVIGVNFVFASPYTTDPNFVVELYVSNVTRPTSMAFIGNDILVLEKGTGDVRLVRDGILQDELVLHVDISRQGERGLLGITTEGSTVYLYFTEAKSLWGEPIANRIYKYTWNGETLQNGVLVRY